MRIKLLRYKWENGERVLDKAVTPEEDERLKEPDTFDIIVRKHHAINEATIPDSYYVKELYRRIYNYAYPEEVQVRNISGPIAEMIFELINSYAKASHKGGGTDDSHQ